MGVIKRIYEEALLLTESKYPTDREYLRMRKELESKLEHLNAMLDDSGKQLLEDVLSLRVSMDGITDVDSFISGFKIGTEMMIEVLVD
jgi:hypothetical protein